MDEYPISYATLTTWEHLKARLEESFDTETFLLFWLLTNKMTLDGTESIKEAISVEFALLLIHSEADYRRIIWDAFRGRAYVISKYTDEICDDEKIRKSIFRNSFLDPEGAAVHLRRIGYLDAVFCRKNEHLLHVSPNAHRGVASLHRYFGDYLDCYASTTDKSEPEILSVLSGEMLCFKMAGMHFRLDEYYRDLDSPFFDGMPRLHQ